MRNTLPLLLFILLFGFAVQAQNRAIKFETGTFADILAKAKKENKPIMMDAYTTWCGPCKMMDKQVFTNDTVADFYNANFIAFKSDMEKGEGIELGKRYEVMAYPNFLFLSADGSVLHRFTGSMLPKEFVKVGKTALDPEKRYGTLQKKYAAGERNPELLANYVIAKGMAALDNSKEMQEYFATQKPAELTSRRNWSLLRNFTRYSSEPAFKQFITQRPAFAKAFTADSVDQFILQVYENEIYRATKKGTAAEVEKIKADLQKLDVKNTERMLWTLDASMYLKKGDVKNYGLTTTKLVDKYYANDPSMLNNYAWDFYEKVDDKTMLHKAETWSAAAVKKDPSYANLDTQAALLYKLGKKKEALATAEKAIAAGKKDGEDITETEALLKKIKAMK